MFEVLFWARYCHPFLFGGGELWENKENVWCQEHWYPVSGIGIIRVVDHILQLF